MATTVTAVAIGLNEGMLYGVHCGDCRLYLVRDRNIVQLTRDHTVIGERMRMGMIRRSVHVTMLTARRSAAALGTT